MNPHWSSAFDYFKDRRLAGIFIRWLLALGIAIAVGAMTFPYSVYALPVAGILLLTWLIRAFLRARERWRYRYRSSPLSIDETNKARKRLMRAGSRAGAGPGFGR